MMNMKIDPIDLYLTCPIWKVVIFSDVSHYRRSGVCVCVYE